MDAKGVLVTFFSGMSPIGEVRLAIPLGRTTYDLAWYEAFGWGVLGNLVPVVLLLWGLGPASRLLLAFPNPAGRLLQWRADRLQRNTARAVQRWGAFTALAVFVAVPLPLSGAWTGCILAWALGLPRRVSLPAVVLGVLVSGAVVTALVEAGLHFPFIKD